MRRNVCRLGLLVLATIGLNTSRVETRQGEALERYARGDFSAVDDLSVDSVDRLRQTTKASTVTSRVKAAFLLEAFESFQRQVQVQPLRFEDPAESQGRSAANDLRVASARILGDACEVIASVQSDTAFVSRWFDAAASALAHGAFGQSDLDWNWFWAPDSLADLDKCHIDKYVAPAELALIRALPAERFAWRSVYQVRETFVTAQQDAFKNKVEKEYLPMVLEREKNAVPRATEQLKRAEAFEASRAESLMRQAAILGASGRVEEALPLFRKSEALASDEWVVYLDRLLTGRALEVLNRTDLAEAAYRGALELRPKARSANLALAALLFARGARADKNTLATLDVGADHLDPWAQFSFGAYRFWLLRRDAMRELLK